MSYRHKQSSCCRRRSFRIVLWKISFKEIHNSFYFFLYFFQFPPSLVISRLAISRIRGCSSGLSWIVSSIWSFRRGVTSSGLNLTLFSTWALLRFRLAKYLSHMSHRQFTIDTVPFSSITSHCKPEETLLTKRRKPKRQNLKAGLPSWYSEKRSPHSR
mgnify:CR=1 FL=1